MQKKFDRIKIKRIISTNNNANGENKMTKQQNRSDALNRYMAQCEQDVADAQMDVKVYMGMAGFIILVLISAIMGWQ